MTEEEKKETTKTTTAKKTTTSKAKAPAKKAPANETAEVVADAVAEPVEKASKASGKVSDKLKDTADKIRDTTNERIEDVTENPTVKQFIEHQKRGFNEAGQAIESLLPEGFKEHGKNAVDAFFESYRALYNGVLENLNVNIEIARKKQNEAIDEVEEALEEAKA